MKLIACLLIRRAAGFLTPPGSTSPSYASGLARSNGTSTSTFLPGLSCRMP